jgi:hypothetical protein
VVLALECVVVVVGVVVVVVVVLGVVVLESEDDAFEPDVADFDVEVDEPDVVDVDVDVVSDEAAFAVAAVFVSEATRKPSPATATAAVTPVAVLR